MTTDAFDTPDGPWLPPAVSGVVAVALQRLRAQIPDDAHIMNLSRLVDDQRLTPYERLNAILVTSAMEDTRCSTLGDLVARYVMRGFDMSRLPQAGAL